MALTTIPASLSATALTLTTAAQPNITSVGTLTGLALTGNLDINGNQLILDADADTSFREAADDYIIMKVGGTDLIKIDGTGLGIGIRPAEMLDIQSASGDARVRLDAPSGSDTEIKFFNAGSAQYTIGHDDATDNFVVGGANVDAALVSVDKSGNVGIGTTSPDTFLHIKGSKTFAATEEHLKIENTASGEPVVLSMMALADNGGTGNEGAIYFDAGADGTVANNLLQFSANHQNSTTPQITIKGDGNVGIGTASPTAELHVNALSENVNLKLTRDTNYGVQITGTDGATTPILRLATINNGTITERLRMNESELRPTTDQGMSLGTAGARYDGLHVKTSATQQFYILGESTTADSSFMMSYFNTSLSGSDSLTADRANYGIYSALNSSATGGTTSNEHRLYGIRSLVKATGDSDLIYGGYFTGEAEHSSGTVSALYGSYNQGTADPNSGGTVSVTYGAFNQASINGSAGSTVTHAYGSWNRVITSTADEVAHSSLTGCYAEIETDPSGTGRTTTTGYLFRGLYDDDSSAEHKFTNFYGLHLGGTNLSTRVDGTGNVAGVYLDMPGVDQGFWNSEDQPNYFRGSLSIGSGGRQVADTVGAELHLVEPDGGEMVLARYDPTIGTNNSLGKIFFGGTEDSGTTVNFSASIQAFAQTAHGATDSDGYLSFYTTPQSSTTLEEQLRITRSGTIKVIRGDIEMPAGQGITFINAADTATGETVSSSVLDDYEEGTYDVSITSQNGTMALQSGYDTLSYTRIGRQVTINGRIRFSTISGASGFIKVNVPFTSVTYGGQGDYAYFSTAGHNVNVAANIYGVFGEMGPNVNLVLLLQKIDNGAWNYWDASGFSSGDYIYLAGTYFTA